MSAFDLPQGEPPSCPDPLNQRDHEDQIGHAARVLTLEAAAAIELRGRIRNAVKLIDGGADPKHIVAVLEGRQPW